MPIIERDYKDTTKHNVKMESLKSILSAVKHAKLHNLQNRNNVDIFWDMNQNSIQHQLFKIKLTGEVDGKRTQMEAVIPFEELLYYGRDF